MPNAENGLEALRYPIGRFQPEPHATPEKRAVCIAEIEQLPRRITDAVSSLAQEQLDVPYRTDGWTVRQLVHHVADSHMNAYVRLKLALTETAPTIKAYDEKLWAQLPDSHLSIEVSLELIEALHARWSVLLRSMKDETFARTWIHQVHGEHDIDYLVQLYSWHSRHHVAHIRGLCERMGWT